MTPPRILPNVWACPVEENGFAVKAHGDAHDNLGINKAQMFCRCANPLLNAVIEIEQAGSFSGSNQGRAHVHHAQGAIGARVAHFFYVKLTLFHKVHAGGVTARAAVIPAAGAVFQTHQHQGLTFFYIGSIAQPKSLVGAFWGVGLHGLGDFLQIFVHMNNANFQKILAPSLGGSAGRGSHKLSNMDCCVFHLTLLWVRLGCMRPAGCQKKKEPALCERGHHYRLQPSRRACV